MLGSEISIVPAGGLSSSLADEVLLLVDGRRGCINYKVTGNGMVDTMYQLIQH